jgi:serine/threonine-protein kinase SRK2
VESLAQVFLTPEYLAICMEYATDGDMFQLVAQRRGLLEKDARWFFQQLIIAVDYCHKMVSVHPYLTLRSLLSQWFFQCQSVSRCLIAPKSYTLLTAEQAFSFQGVANRDIKLENTLLDGSPRPLIKICDFGYSKVRWL